MNKLEATSCVPNCSQGIHMHGTSLDHQEMASSSSNSIASTSDTFSTSLLYNLSILKDKFHQVQSLATISISPEPSQPAAPTATTIASMTTLIEEIIITASSMMFTCQQMSMEANSHKNHANESQKDRAKLAKDELSQPNSETNRAFCALEGREEEEGILYSCETPRWYGDYVNHEHVSQRAGNNEGPPKIISDDIIELNASDLLAKYTHYCQICGKGFKRDANLRMHMRAHGDEYKTNGALVNPMKKKEKNVVNSSSENKDGLSELLPMPRKYSCPEEGCRWNRKHAKFQPLKSMICVKNHYKRSHCPKLYVCRRCNRKQFSVLSDLRTHEKHCGVLKWQCSCGTTFSRKDKLMGHVALFAGHNPIFR